jgi:hypothetical protein
MKVIQRTLRVKNRLFFVVFGPAPLFFHTSGSYLNQVVVYSLPKHLQPFAKRLAVTELGDFENKQSKIDPSVGFSAFQPSCSRSPPSAALCRPQDIQRHQNHRYASL